MIVLETTARVVQQTDRVRIVDRAVDAWTAATSREALRPIHQELYAAMPGDREQIANLVLLIDALNFCFWSPRPISTTWQGRTYHRFEAMLVSLMNAARTNPRWFDAAYWAEAPAVEIRPALLGDGELLLMDDRVNIVHQTGRALLDRFDGRFIEAVDSVNGDAWALAVLLMTNFDSYRDVSTFRHQPVYILKRAQICALDLSIAWQMMGHPTLANLEALTAFADYRVPQALRHLGILELSPDLAAKIDGEIELDRESEDEVSLRAASIQAVQRMRRNLESIGKPTPAWQIDWYLWGLSHGDDLQVKHHRTRTICY